MSACVAADLDARGVATVGPLLDEADCAALRNGYGDDPAFRSRVVMAQHGFGRGDYRYYAYPLPGVVAALRTALYPPLAAVADRREEALGRARTFPAQRQAFLDRCRAQGQIRPTPLLLRYGAGDYNCLHQDLYGEVFFPLQATVLLDRPGRDFEGGEFILTEQRPRRQTRAEVVTLGQGEAVIFAVHHRPIAGSRGVHRAVMRHGISRVRSGHRHALGVIFHDAR